MRFQLQRLGFQYISDLHLERHRRVPIIPALAEYLILAGDIGHPQTELYHEFLLQCSRQHSKVFMVFGNHEWDRGSPYPYTRLFPKNVHVLENQTYTFPGAELTIVGCTLWTPQVRLAENCASVRFLERTLRALRHASVCVTHHLPSYQLITPQFARYPRKDRFANNLDMLFRAPYAPRVWISGHSHCVLERQIGNTHCRINAQPWKTLQVEAR